MNKGFSIVELIVVIGIVGVLASTVTIFTRSFQRQNDLKVSVVTVAQALHVARAEAIAVDGDGAWGVSVQNGQAVVFKGKTYASRSASFDQFYSFPSSVTSTGTTEFDFSKFSATTTAATSTLVIASPAATTTIVVNAQGIVNY